MRLFALDEKGKPDFKEVIHRMQRSNEGDIQRAMKKNPVYCYLFDLLYLDGRAVVNEPLTRRREWLKDAVKKDSSYRLSDIVEDGKALFDAATELGLEGIMAKEKNSKYLPANEATTGIKLKLGRLLKVISLAIQKAKATAENYSVRCILQTILTVKLCTEEKSEQDLIQRI